ncbi:hypothetical protein BKA56DRAFT_609832 [Ilyonectria sp. MPI-CAGE-AT-0026]|nr:hypothetical protein BKA56DRAFT_609832 [Ilyonectria sp. MPI-CAGE-AT-0026]
MVTHHKFMDNYGETAALTMKADTDLECNNTPGTEFLLPAWEQGLVSQGDVDKALTRLMTALLTVGMFDPAQRQKLWEIGWDAVNTEVAQHPAYKAAFSGSVLIQNDGILPLSLGSSGPYAFIDPFIEAGEQMQGIYSGPVPYLISPVEAAKVLGFNVTSYKGSSIDEMDDLFESAIEAAKGADHRLSEQAELRGGSDNTEELVAKVDTDSVTGSLTWPTILQEPFTTPQAEVTNTSEDASDYVALLVQKNNAGPKPRPFKTMSAYTRIRDIQAGDTASAKLEITLERLFRVMRMATEFCTLETTSFLLIWMRSLR